MKPKDVEVGKTYVNKGAGRTKRQVFAISKHLTPPIWFGRGDPPDDYIVEYEQSGRRNRMYLKSFASWCGSEVKNG